MAKLIWISSSHAQTHTPHSSRQRPCNRPAHEDAEAAAALTYAGRSPRAAVDADTTIRTPLPTPSPAFLRGYAATHATAHANAHATAPHTKTLRPPPPRSRDTTSAHPSLLQPQPPSAALVLTRRGCHFDLRRDVPGRPAVAPLRSAPRRPRSPCCRATSICCRATSICAATSPFIRRSPLTLRAPIRRTPDADTLGRTRRGSWRRSWARYHAAATRRPALREPLTSLYSPRRGNSRSGMHLFLTLSFPGYRDSSYYYC
jgi:hypothetical protein